MERRTRIVVYGNSLNMAGIAASLRAEASLDVICVHPRGSTVPQRLIELNPAVIAFDLQDTETGLDVNLLREQPGLLLIGVDASSDEVLVMSSRPSLALSVADLIDVIRQRQPTTEPTEREPR